MAEPTPDQINKSIMRRALGVLDTELANIDLKELIKKFDALGPLTNQVTVDAALAAAEANANATYADKTATARQTFAGPITAGGQVVATDMRLVLDTVPNVGPETHLFGYRGGWLDGAIDVANAPTSRDLVAVAKKNEYYVADGVTTSGSDVFTSAADGQFGSTALVGNPIVGPGIPNGTTVLSVQSATMLTMSASATATATGLRVRVGGAGVGDLIYISHRGSKSPTIGLGVTPPGDGYRVRVGGAPADEAAMGSLALQMGAGQRGGALAVFDSAATKRMWLASNGEWHHNPDVGGFIVRDAGASGRSLVVTTNGGAGYYGFRSSGTDLVLGTAFGSDQPLRFDVNGALGFFGAAPVVRQTRPVDLAGVINVLANLGLTT